MLFTNIAGFFVPNFNDIGGCYFLVFLLFGADREFDDGECVVVIFSK